MLNIGLRKLLTHSVAGLALFTTVNVTLPSASLAQRQPISSTTKVFPLEQSAPQARLATDYALGGGDSNSSKCI